MKRYLIAISKVILVLAIVYVGILAAGFFGLKFGLTNAPSGVDPMNETFQKNNKKVSLIKKVDDTIDNPLERQNLEKLTDGQISAQIDKLVQIREIRGENYCKIKAVGNMNPFNAQRILETYEITNASSLAAKMIMAVSLRFQGDLEFQDAVRKCEEKENASSRYALTRESLKENFNGVTGASVFPWMNDEVWKTIEAATLKDKELIQRAGEEAGVEPRLIVASMVVEQLRLFHTQREMFEKFFKPLKILGNATKMSLGVMGIKEATAIQIENHLKDPSSEYYLGKEYEHLLDFSTANSADERYKRLTDEKNHYYSYLYSALYLKQIMTQWKNAGYDIGDRPEIIGTLFNVGFPQSRPNPNPKIGGSKINVGEGTYSFGSLAYEFYYSGELLEAFPYENIGQ